MSNPKRRESDGSLLADLRRRMLIQERKRVPAGAKKLDDLSDVAVPTPATNDVLTFTGAQWVNAPSVAGDIAVSEAIATYTDSGSFDEVSDYQWETPGFVVAANSYQPVFITVDVAVSDLTLLLTGTGFPGDASVDVPAPWKLHAFDVTNDPTGALASLGNGSGSCGITVPLWLRNETDEEASLSVSVIVSGVVVSSASGGLDATIDARAESVFQMAAIP